MKQEIYIYIKRKVSSPHSPTPSPGLLLIGCGPFSHEVKYLLHFKAFYASLKFTGMKRSVPVSSRDPERSKGYYLFHNIMTVIESEKIVMVPLDILKSNHCIFLYSYMYRG